MNQPRKFAAKTGFTLMEAMMSVAVLVFALTVVVGALGSAARLAAQDRHKNTALGLLQDCFTDLATAAAAQRERSALFHLQVPSAPAKADRQQIWFNVEGVRVAEEKEAYFRCELGLHPDANPALVHVHGHVRWPARGNPNTPEGEAELLTSIALP